MKRLFVTLAVAAGVLLAAAYVFRTELATRAMRGVVASNLQTDLAPRLVALLAGSETSEVDELL